MPGLLSRSEVLSLVHGPIISAVCLQAIANGLVRSGVHNSPVK